MAVTRKESVRNDPSVSKTQTCPRQKIWNKQQHEKYTLLYAYDGMYIYSEVELLWDYWTWPANWFWRTVTIRLRHNIITDICTWVRTIMQYRLTTNSRRVMVQTIVVIPNALHCIVSAAVVVFWINVSFGASFVCLFNFLIVFKYYVTTRPLIA